MKQLFLAFAISIINPRAQAACGPFFGKLFKQAEQGFSNTPAYKYRARQKRLEDQANRFRTRKDNPDPALNLKIYEKIEKMNVFIFNDIHAPNERTWRTFFRGFEADYISFERLTRLLDKLPDDFSKADLEKIISSSTMKYPKVYQEFLLKTFDSMEGAKAFKSALQFERTQAIPKLATNYQEYRMVRGNLEDLLKRSDCDEICKKQVNMLLGRLGVESDKEKMVNDVFFIGGSRPDTAKMRELLYNEPEFVLTKLKRERNAEFFRFLKSFVSQPEFIDTLFGYIYKNPKLKDSPRVNFLFREIYNSHARNSHFPKISKVIRSPDNDSQAFDLLQRLNSSVPKDELLITFARRVDSLADTRWKKLLDYATANEPAFAKRMEKAVEVAEKRGDMSPTDRRSFVGRLAAAIVVGVPTFSYFYFDIKPGDLMEIIYDESDGEVTEDSGSSTTTEITEPESEDSDQDKDKDKDKEETLSTNDLPTPDNGEPLLSEGENEEILEEAVEVILDVTQALPLERGPSSVSDRPLFSKLWCSVFKCSKK
jgi:hypothetical protein